MSDTISIMDETPEATDSPQMPTSPSLPPAEVKPTKSKKRIFIFLGLAAVLIIAAVLWLTLDSNKKNQNLNAASKVRVTKTAAQASSSIAKVQGLQLDKSKNYGNKYANGVLPVGDGKFTTTSPKVGYVYTCSQYAQNLSSSQGGASTRGPWFTDNNTMYDINKKQHVEGDVMWQASFSNTTSGETRVISTNDLPSQPTGIFPIATNDPAYMYDHNPNSIKGQNFVYNLPLSPTYGSPQCMGGESGIMLTGVALFNALDAGGRDAGAWEIQDSCDGHPQSDGIYHYHTLSSCIKNVSVTTVIGYALDGFPITGPEIAPNDYLTTSDLDECHGIVSQISLDGKNVTMYHYVMTQDYPYSVSCFRGTAIQPPDLAQHLNGQNQNSSGPKRSQPPPAN